MKKILVALAVVLGIFAGTAGMTTLLAAQRPDPIPDGQGGDAGGGISDAVPEEYRDWILKAGSMCPEISPALVAAQIDAESGWNPRAVSPVGAQGLSQFMPGTWPQWGRDDDNNGRADAFDPGDAIMAQGRFDCWNVKRLEPSGLKGDDLIAAVLAAYNAGPGAVCPRDPCTKARIPQIAETLGYIKRILSLIPKYQGTPPSDGGGGGRGGWVNPVRKVLITAAFRKPGDWSRGWHTGTDYAVPLGTPIMSTAAGTVEHAAWGNTAGGTGGAYGLQTIINHGKSPQGYVMRTYYAHQQSVAVKKGDKVRAGQVIGQVGMTGRSFGPHVHVELTLAGDPSTRANDGFADVAAWIKKNSGPATGGGGNTGDAGAKAVAAAKSQLGKPYSLGGGTLTGPSAGLDGRTGWDCSSLTRYAWHAAGKTLPRTTGEQAAKLREVPMNQIRPGDILLFKTGSSSGWSHAGLYIGGGKMVHAANKSKPVETRSVTDGYYASIPVTARRPA